MTPTRAFAPDQWRLISSLPVEVAAAASVADTSREGTTREVLAALSTLLNGAKLLRHNSLVRSVFDDYKEDGRGEAAILKLSQDPPADLVERTLARVREVGELLDQHADREEIAEFKLWVRGIASDIVMSSTSGGFLGFAINPLTEDEISFLNQLTEALGLELNPSS